MKSNVEYGQDIVVGTKYMNQFRWYISEKEIWIMDQRKWTQAFVEAGYDVSEDDYSERFNIPILNENTAEGFFKSVENDYVTTQHLQALLKSCGSYNRWDDFSHLMPSLFVDFDDKKLISHFPELLEFERYVPEGWEGTYGRFYELIPEEHQYWIINGKNLVAEFTDKSN
jgi:hypothetical protein